MKERIKTIILVLSLIAGAAAVGYSFTGNYDAAYSCPASNPDC
jgi:hypothetical protein